MPLPRTIFALLSCAILLQSRQVTAQSIPSAYRFIEHSQEGGLFAGVTSLNPGQLGVGPKSADALGGRYSVSFGSALAFEGDATFFKGLRDVIDIRESEENQLLGESSIDLLAFQVRLRINLTGQRSWRGLQPFVSFGGGMALSSNLDRTLEDEANMLLVDRYDFGSKFIAALGSGINLHLSSKLMLRVDGVMNLWKISTPAGWITDDTDLGVFPEDEWVSAKSLSLGASWRL